MNYKIGMLSLLLPLFLFVTAGCGSVGYQVKPESHIRARSFNSVSDFCKTTYNGLIRWPSTILTYKRMDGQLREQIALTESIVNNSKA